MGGHTDLFQNFEYFFELDFISLWNLICKIVTSLINDNTKMIWTENLLPTQCQILVCSDELKISNANNLLLVVDNTFATPYLILNLDLGADIDTFVD